MPALETASAALEALDKKDITELKAFSTPPKAVMIVCMCVVVLKPLGKESESDGWNGARAMLTDGGFLRALIDYPKNDITGKAKSLLWRISHVILTVQPIRVDCPAFSLQKTLHYYASR